MIDHISLPVADYARSRAFYDKAMGALGYKVAMEMTDSPEFIAAGYGPADRPEPGFWIGSGREPGRYQFHRKDSTLPFKRPIGPL
jgi:catechol 2,3-dioxygenase-like lactoylglutathione lyase family enzyme